VATARSRPSGDHTADHTPAARVSVRATPPDGSRSRIAFPAVTASTSAAGLHPISPRCPRSRAPHCHHRGRATPCRSAPTGGHCSQETQASARLERTPGPVASPRAWPPGATSALRHQAPTTSPGTRTPTRRGQQRPPHSPGPYALAVSWGLVRPTQRKTRRPRSHSRQRRQRPLPPQRSATCARTRQTCYSASALDLLQRASPASYDAGPAHPVAQ
jgi:hypothetical protein